MAEYISREAFKGKYLCCGYLPEMQEKEFDEFPAADVEPVRHGRWLCVDTDTEQFFLCNRCKKKEYWESNYCPNCGAKMNEEVTDNG